MVKKYFHSQYRGEKEIDLELFTWEKLDYVDILKKEFGI
jgi:S-adenosylmethionine synthetase